MNVKYVHRLICAFYCFHMHLEVSFTAQLFLNVIVSKKIYAQFYVFSCKSLRPISVKSNIFSSSSFFTLGLQEIIWAKIRQKGRVPTSSGNHGKPGKSLIKIPCMEKSWTLIKL